MGYMLPNYIKQELISIRFDFIDKFYIFGFKIYCNFFCLLLSLKKLYNFCQSNKYFHLSIALPLIILLLSGFIKDHKVSYTNTLVKEVSYFPLNKDYTPILNLPSSGEIPLNPNIGNFFNNYSQFEHFQIIQNKHADSLFQLAMVSIENAELNPRIQDFINIDDILAKQNKIPQLNMGIPQSDVNLEESSFSRRKKSYAEYISNYSKKYGLNPKMVYAIIYAESHFIPHLVSKKNAHGLMQIVPSSAGTEVYKFLKKSGQPSPQELMHPETNISYGTAYLYILKRFHLIGIHDSRVKDLLAIASYNAGSGSVLRHFDSNRSTAIEIINSMPYEDILTSMLLTFRFAETRRYVRKVLSYMGSL